MEWGRFAFFVFGDGGGGVVVINGKNAGLCSTTQK